MPHDRYSAAERDDVVGRTPPDCVPMIHREEYCGWRGDFQTLLETETPTITRELSRFLLDRSGDQLAAWDSSLGILRSEAAKCITELPEARWFAAILEYELPRDHGRRPDVVVLENGTVAVIEFKERGRILQVDHDQVAAYARDLGNYHSACDDRRLVPILVPTRYRGGPVVDDGVHVCSPSGLGRLLVDLTSGSTLARPDSESWVRGEYAPLPGLVEAARILFQRSPLPRIKRAESARIPEVVARVIDVAATAQREGARHLVLLTGVPGSGKTLVGLQVAHHGELRSLIPAHERSRGAPAVFLSGNGPLVDVLQRALKGKEFVQSLKDYLFQYAVRTDASPPEHVIVFDEAQRAWDVAQVAKKHLGKLPRSSEPKLLLDIAERIPGWCLVVAVLGEGQEIHVGEEAGLDLWRDALGSSNARWIVHGPARLSAAVGVGGSVYVNESLFDLTTSLRSHAAVELHNWVRLLLEGRLDEAQERRGQLSYFSLYATRDLGLAKAYVRRRYEGHHDRRYGLLASSCAENLEAFALRLREDRNRGDYARWFEGPPSGRGSCCGLVDAVSEFGCQGLELDYAITCWGNDLTWTGAEWRQVDGKRKRAAADRNRLRLNAYRVLLTRGRDGTCIFVPPAPAPLMDATYEALVRAGATPLLGDSEDQPAD